MVAGYQFIAQNIYGGKIEGVYILLAIFPLAAYALNLTRYSTRAAGIELLFIRALIASHLY